MTLRRHIVGVIGASRASDEGLALAEQVGRLIAESGAALVCGGLGGVMTAAAKGCSQAGGEAIGILPGPDAGEANPYITLAIPTNMGHARNMVIAHSAQVLIAVEGEYGTLSEAAVALKLGKRVFALRPQFELAGMTAVSTAEQAVSAALTEIGSLSGG